MADVDPEVLDYSSDDDKKAKVTKNKTAAKNTAKAKPNPQQKKNLNLHASSFNDFHLRQELTRAIGEVGFEHPSEGQPKEYSPRVFPTSYTEMIYCAKLNLEQEKLLSLS